MSVTKTVTLTSLLSPDPAASQYKIDVCQRLTGLRLCSNRNGAVVVGAEWKLARDKDKPIGYDGLAVMAARLRSKIAADEFHRRASISSENVSPGNPEPAG